MDLAYPPGVPPARPGPLARFLPPIESGAVGRLLETFPAGWVLDPFGVSPLLAIEAARIRGAVVAVSNSVTRFVLEARLNPLDADDLSGALAQLSAAPKDGGRLEPFLLDLYRSTCANCGSAVIVDYFVWDRERELPVEKVYHCGSCQHPGEDPTTPEDCDRATETAGRGLARALATERAATGDDPDREHVENALAVYPPRALYALITALQKAEQIDFPGRQKQAAQALLLSAFDAANGLWGDPETRARPKQLIASPRFREINVWRALERAVDEWRFEPPGVELATWPAAELPQPGVLSMFAGPIRELEDTLPPEVPRIMTALPRPNQAYWTLSALWASWLWGKDSAAPIRIVLRRRRYDWTWHAAALRGAFAALVRRQPEGSAVAAFVPEAEHGFLAAAAAGLDAAGYRLRGHAVRLHDDQAVLTWESARHRAPDETPLSEVMRDAAERALVVQGEPAGYGHLYVAAALELARRRNLADLWASDDAPPLTRLTDEMQAVLASGGLFERLEPRAEIESGHYWLVDPGPAGTPLSDRVEGLVLETLRMHPGLDLLEIEIRLCGTLRGLQTPDRRLLLACLMSYANEDGVGGWHLRPEDEEPQRVKDAGEIRDVLGTLGRRLAYDVDSDDGIVWNAGGRSAFEFRVQTTAAIGGLLRASPVRRSVIVIPGGRASLVAEKERRDPRLRAWMAGGGRIVKFRHIRRLAADASVRRENFAERLGIDPAAREDPQLPLL